MMCENHGSCEMTILAQANQVDIKKTIGASTSHSDETMMLYYSHINTAQMEKAASILERETEDSFGE